MSRHDRTRGSRWADFLDENHPRLTAYALALTGNMDDARDLIQDVLVRLVEQARTVRDEVPFVMRCLRNLAIDRRRAARTRPTHTGVDDLAACGAAAFIDTNLTDPARRASADRVKQALECLPSDRREVIVLKIYANLTFRDIATILDRPIGTVTSTYARGLDELRAIYIRELKHVC
ncbi:MAG: RNA polymerase sigma factor [Planctomycetota bacterium]